jgi:hypothetical protein
MTRRAATVTQAEITRVVKAVQAAGVVVGRIEVDANGKIIVTSAPPGAAMPPADEFEAWEAKRASLSQRD